MSRINKTQNNLQSVWNNLDLAYEHMERAIEDLSQNNLQSVWNNLDLAYEYMERAIEDLLQMTGLPDELEKIVEQYDLSEISMIKQEVEELMK